MRLFLSRACLVGARTRFAVSSGPGPSSGFHHHHIDSKLSSRLSSEASLHVDVIKAIASSSNRPELSRFLREFAIVRTLGRGAFGVVLAVVNRIDLQEYAVKCLRVDPEHPVSLNEVRMMARLASHRNVVRYFAGWIEPNQEASDHMQPIRDLFERKSPTNLDFASTSLSDAASSSRSDSAAGVGQSTHFLFIQMEFCRSGSLRAWLQQRIDNIIAVDPARCSSYFAQIVLGLQHLHHHGVTHNDLKPDNIFRDGDQLKLGDFGLSVDGNGPHAEFGTASYAPPTSSERGSIKVDIFALGICLMELFSTFRTEMERVAMIRDVRSGSFNNAEWAIQFPLVRALVQRMTSALPEDRPNTDQILSWPFLQSNLQPMTAPLLVHSLQDQLKRKQATINRLRAELQRLASSELTIA